MTKLCVIGPAWGDRLEKRINFAVRRTFRGPARSHQTFGPRVEANGQSSWTGPDCWIGGYQPL